MAQAKAKLSRAPARSKPARLVNHNRTQLGYAVSFLADAERRFPPKVFDRFVFELVNMYIDHNHEQRAFSKADQSKLERCAKSVRAIRRPGSEGADDPEGCVARLPLAARCGRCVAST